MKTKNYKINYNKKHLENIDKALSIDNEYEDAIKLKEYINNLD